MADPKASQTGPSQPKRVHSVRHAIARHWVGDGFPVRTLFAYSDLGALTTPFLLLDHAGPVDFAPTTERRGVGAHPHRGFETVTIVYDGEVEHRDSAGGGGSIGPGDVQWMTAASGLVHEEFHGARFAREGGRFEMAQLWVNLPARDKRGAPRYQAIADAQIPAVNVGSQGSDAVGRARVIAGEYFGAKGPAHTFTPLHVVDLELDGDGALELPSPHGWTAIVVVLKGTLRVNGTEDVGASEAALMERDGDHIRIEGARGARLLLLGGEPIDEPIVGHGPFVMNTTRAIAAAIDDFRQGRMGHLA